jgi:hypothetical protein
VKFLFDKKHISLIVLVNTTALFLRITLQTLFLIVINNFICGRSQHTVLKSPRCSSGKRACYWTQGSRSSNQAEGSVFLRPMKSAARLLSEVKPSAPRRMILRNFKEPFEAWKRYFVRQNCHFLRQFLPLCYLFTSLLGLLGSTCGRIRSPMDIIPPWFSMLIYRLGDEQ